MKITYDDVANASYIYFTVIGVGGVKETVMFEEMAVDLDSNNQIISLRLVETEDCEFRNRVKYLVPHPEVEYGEGEGCIQINFARGAPVERTLVWDANVDLDFAGQIVGIEILFAPPGYELSAKGKLEHIEKYRVPFDDVY